MLSYQKIQKRSVIMFLVLSLTVSGSVLALAVLLVRALCRKRLGGAERWLWLVVLLRLCLPLPGPVNLLGDAFWQLQEEVRVRYIAAEEDWLLDENQGRDRFRQAMAQVADAIPADAGHLPFGEYHPDTPIRIPLPARLRAANPNTWLMVWGAGAAVCFCWSLFYYRRRPLRFKWFSAAVLSLHWFNPLMFLVRWALRDCPSGKIIGRKGQTWTIAGTAVLAAIGLCLGALPGGTHADYFWSADQFVFHLNAEALTGKLATDRFLAKTERGEPAFLRVVKVFPDTAAQGEVPQTYVWLYDFYFDGEMYHAFYPGADYNSPYQQDVYPYLVREQREIPTNDAIDYAVEYLLTDNAEVDWYDRVLQMSMRVENPCRFRTVLHYYIYAETE